MELFLKKEEINLSVEQGGNQKGLTKAYCLNLKRGCRQRGTLREVSLDKDLIRLSFEDLLEYLDISEEKFRDVLDSKLGLYDDYIFLKLDGDEEEALYLKSATGIKTVRSLIDKMSSRKLNPELTDL